MTRNKEAQAAMSARKLFYLGHKAPSPIRRPSMPPKSWHGSNRKAST